MPHCIIECSSDLKSNLQAIVTNVHSSTLSSELFELIDIKTRAMVYDYYQVGAVRAAFIHVCAKILTGRTSEQKIALSQSILKGLEALKLKDCSLTVEIVDIEKSSYSKMLM